MHAMSGPDDSGLCKQVPALVSSFVDAFVDYAVGGQVLSNPQAEANAAPPTRLPGAERLIAIGDIHGDLKKARAALQVAEVIDEHDYWIGGETVVVQVGDVFDRGGDEIKVLYLLEKLHREARRAGGAVHVMNGNHEVMNMEGDFRCATDAGLAEFRAWAHWHALGSALKSRCAGLAPPPRDIFSGVPASFPPGLRARIAALRPGGPLATRFLAPHPVVLVVGAFVFVHGGLLPEHVSHGLERINAEVREWMLGRRGWSGPAYLHGADALVWLRKFSEVEESRCDCELLARCLAAIDGAQRMVVGHTQQPVGVNGACENRVIRVDVGLSRGCADGTPQVLEIRGDREMRVLSSRLPPALIGEKPGLASLLTG